ncbi:MAG: DNA-directed RNA polymerase subunit alpha C-terminal domain-containing protein [Bacillota bacterium]
MATGPSLEELGLSARLLNALHEAGINSIEELTAHTSSQLLAIKGFGAKSLEDVIEKLKALGLALRQE